MIKIYFAKPLFSQADLRYNAYLVGQIWQLSKTIDLHLPQEGTAINDRSTCADSKMIVLADTENILTSGLLVALSDGPTIDAGVVSEVGVAYAKGIPMAALHTDSCQQGTNNHRKLDALSEIAENQFRYLSLYTVGLIKLNSRVVSSEEDLLEEIGQRLS